MTPRSLILMKAFGFYGRFSEAMSFSKFATSVSKVTIDVPKMSIVWLPRVKCLLLLKNEDSMNKEKNSLRTSVVLQSGKGTQRNSSLPQSWRLIQKKQILKMTLLQKNGSRIKTPPSKSLILVSFCRKIIFYAFMHSLFFFAIVCKPFLLDVITVHQLRLHLLSYLPRPSRAQCMVRFMTVTVSLYNDLHSFTILI